MPIGIVPQTVAGQGTRVTSITRSVQVIARALFGWTAAASGMVTFASSAGLLLMRLAAQPTCGG